MVALESNKRFRDFRALAGKVGLAGAALGALASVVCWAVPLVLLGAGTTGAWMSTFTMFGPYKSFLVGASLACLTCAWFGIYCAKGGGATKVSCASSSRLRIRGLFWSVSALVLGAIVSPYLLPLFLGE